MRILRKRRDPMQLPFTKKEKEQNVDEKLIARHLERTWNGAVLAATREEIS